MTARCPATPGAWNASACCSIGRRPSVNDEPFARCDASVAFLRNLNDDWADLVACLHDPKAAREPHEALVRAIGYQQLTAKADDAIIARLKAFYPIPPSRALQNRVTPFGDIVAIPQRGMFTGNRGIIHNPATKTLL